MNEAEDLLKVVDWTVKDAETRGDPREAKTLTEAAEVEPGKYNLIRSLSWLSAVSGEGLSVSEVAALAREIIKGNPEIKFREYYETLTRRVSDSSLVKA